MIRVSFERKLFSIVNGAGLALIAVLCTLPLLHILAVSLSVNWAAEAGLVGLWPIEPSIRPYAFILRESRFADALLISFKRAGLGIVINMSLTILAAYPLSRTSRQFRLRNLYVWYFLITILFGGGLIPLYMVVRYTGLIDSIWALLIPSAVPVFNVILLQNFFKTIPGEIEESAYIDGAGHWVSMLAIYVPLSAPALATLTLFVVVGHWNAWFDGLIFMNRPEHYPLQSYLQTVVVQRDLKAVTIKDISEIIGVSERNSKAAQIFIAMVPILLIYPFLQKYFTQGIVLGSVKG
jgi:putative aldouronate transport system permease protein